MKRTILLLGVALAAGAGGYLLHDRLPRTGAPGERTSAPVQLWTCGMHPQVIQDHPGNCPICGMVLTPLRVGGDRPHDHSISIDPVMVQNMGVRTARVVEAPLRGHVRAVGVLEEAQPGQHDVTLRVSGFVEHLYADTEGMHVIAGQPLFELYSPELEAAVGELIGARRARGSGAGDALADAARRKLRLLGLTDAQVNRLATLDRPPATVTFTSPITGHLTVKNVVDGSAVTAGQQVMRIVDHTALWIDAQVFEQQLALVRLGQEATATVAALPGRTFTGTVVFIHPHLDMTTRTAMVRLLVPNPKLELRPGMYATVSIATDVAPDAVLVPRDAVIDTGTRQVVFLAHPGGRFEPRDVTVGIAGDDDMVQVLTGLQAGETVVVSGQFLLDAESRLQEAIRKHLAPTALPAPTTAASDGIVVAYLALARDLASRDAEAAPVDPAALRDAASALADDPRLGPQATVIRDAAVALAGQPLATQRTRFLPLSEATIALVGAVPPSAAVAARLLVLRCSMAEGRWLQTDDAVANPFYGTSMQTCGEVERVLR